MQFRILLQQQLENPFELITMVVVDGFEVLQPKLKGRVSPDLNLDENFAEIGYLLMALKLFLRLTRSSSQQGCDKLLDSSRLVVEGV